MKKKIIVLYDNNEHGHHPTYQKLISKILLDSGYSVWFFCRKVDEIAKWLKNNCEKRKLECFKYFQIKKVDKGNILERRFWGARNWARATADIKKLEIRYKCKPDIVIFLKLDDFVKGIINGRWIDKRFPYQWAGLFIHIEFPEKFKFLKIRNKFYQPLSIFSSKRCTAVATLQEDIVKRLENTIAKRVFVLPDFTDESPPDETKITKDILRKSGAKKIIALVGGQDRRKGSFLLFEIAKRCLKKEWIFAFVGKMNYENSDKELSLLQKNIGNYEKWKNCYFHFERIPYEKEFNSIISICDLMFAVYKDFPFSSNIMTKAALFNIPIVVSTGGLMEKRVNKYGTGISCNPENIDGCINAIKTVLKNPPDKKSYETYRNEHSYDTFKERYLSFVKNIIE